MKLIFIYALPATGKLTVAQELAALTGYKLFHNHLTVDLLLSVFEFGSEGFVKLREQIWLSVFEQAGQSGLPGLIFTFAPEWSVRQGFIGDAIEVVRRGGGEVEFVKLTCPLAELKARMDSASRQGYGKLTSVTLFERMHAEGSFDDSYMPEPKLTLDTSVCSPKEAALRIVQELGLSEAAE